MMDSYTIIFHSDCGDEEIEQDMVYYSESILEIETQFDFNVAKGSLPDKCGIEIWGDTLIYSTDGVITDVDIIEILKKHAAINR